MKADAKSRPEGRLQAESPALLGRSALGIVLLLVAIWASRAEAQSVKIVLVGDSTVAEGGGWGPGFRAAMGSGYEVVNLARNGRSSKSFRDEGAWAPALTAGAKYILIQFGHNDGPGKGPDRETNPGTSFHANMADYVEEARAAGAIPILLTSIVRRNLTPEGKVKADSLVPYVEEVRRVAAEEKVAVIDLYELTLEQCETLGPARCAELNARAADGSADTTHLSAKGQAEIGALVARKFSTMVLPWVGVPGR
jgi:pectinesterase